MSLAEYLVEIDIHVDGVDEAGISRLRSEEALRARELVGTGNLVRLWRIQGKWANVGIWRASSDTELTRMIDSLPLRPYMQVSYHQLEPHPSDPGTCCRE